jgi:hypothetical protein
LPSLENTWPHNTSHERHQGKLKGVQRASLLQCGFPEAAWDSSAGYSAVALAVSEFAPILPHERGANGEPLDAHLTKAKWTCWQAFHNGSAFTGPIQPYGRLCFYRDTSGHPMTSPALPGFFAGWRLERGVRYRGVLLIFDYELARGGNFSSRSLRCRPQQEVVFPELLEFPFARARDIALGNLATGPPLPDAPVLALDNLPWQDNPEDGPSTGRSKKQLSIVAPPVSRRRFCITPKRVIEYGPTPGCKGCNEPAPEGSRQPKHSQVCVERFAFLLQADGL